MKKSDCDRCGGDQKLCLQISHNKRGAWVKMWLRTKYCNVNKTGTPHRHNLVPCECQSEEE